MTTVARVKLWGRTIGAVSVEDGARVAAFQYHPAILARSIQPAPIMMPLRRQTYRFPGLPLESFHGLPGMLADSLPDKYGNALIDAWLATQGRTSNEFNVVERLCYTGTRGMGALEFFPSTGPRSGRSAAVHVDALVALASEILTHRTHWHTSVDGAKAEAGLREILRVGTSAGGARAKAVIAWNRQTNEVRSGQVKAADGFEYWLLKFDGVAGNRDKDLDDPTGFGAVEFAYARMATAAGVRLSECRLFEEHGRRHFMTRRFDRTASGAKLHMQSLAALGHYDYNAPGAHSYEEALLIIRRLGLLMDAIEEQFRRMVFNVVARNQDDHVKNIAFLMDESGSWSLAPAFDLTYSYNPTGPWTAQHQMSINGKRDHFTVADFHAVARVASMKRGRADAILADVIAAVRRWEEFATEADVMPTLRTLVQENLRLNIRRE